MALTIKLSDAVRQQLATRAAKYGLTVEELVVKYIIQELDKLEARELSNTTPDVIVECTQPQQR